MDGHSDRVQPFPYWLVTFDGTRLRKCRRDREMSQEWLSRRSRVSLGTIQRVEKLTAATCHRSTLYRLARVLSPDPDALIAELTAGFGTLAAPASHKPPPRLDRWWQRDKPFPSARTELGRYDAATARELLGMTSEFPDTKAGMLILLTEYRHALRDLATESAGRSS